MYQDHGWLGELETEMRDNVQSDVGLCFIP